MGINLKEDTNGNIVFSDKQSYTTDDLLKKYRNDLYAKKLLEAQIEKAPQQIQEKEQEKKIREDQIKEIESRLNKSEEIFKKRNIDPQEELKKLREKYSDEELNEKAKKVSEKRTFEVKDKGNHIERITKNTISVEDELILYASNKFYKLQAQETLTNIQNEIEKIQSRLEAQKEQLNEVKNSTQAVEKYFKKKRLDINKLLDEQAQKRKKGQKEAEEINA